MRSLSGGMKRRVLIAQALVHKPPVIILDEPTAGVDVELRQGLWQFVRRLNRDGHTIVLTTHYLEEAELHCSRIAMLKAGRVVALDSTRNLLARFAGSRTTARVVARDGTQHRASLNRIMRELETRARPAAPARRGDRRPRDRPAGPRAGVPAAHVVTRCA